MSDIEREAMELVKKFQDRHGKDARIAIMSNGGIEIVRVSPEEVAAHDREVRDAEHRKSVE